jgi:hypothetical protein
VTTPPTSDQLEAGRSREDVRYRIPAEFRCLCGYDLRGLTLTGRCPECGRGVIETIRAHDVRYDRSRATVGSAALTILLASVFWGWAVFLWAPGSARPQVAPVWLLAAAGPHPALGFALLARNARGFASIGIHLVFWAHFMQVLGMWALTSAVPAVANARSLRWAAWSLRLTLIGVTVAAYGIYFVSTVPDPAMVPWMHVLEVPLGMLWGAYVWQVGVALRSRLIRWHALALGTLMPLASITMAAGVVYRWVTITDTWRHVYATGLGLAAAGMLVLMIGILSIVPLNELAKV